MFLTATSTDFALLQQKVDLLSGQFSNTVTTLSITLAALFGLFLVLQLISWQQTLKRTVSDAKKELDEKIQNMEREMTQALNDFKNTAQKDFYVLTCTSNSENGRAMAVAYEQQKKHDPAFHWYLWAAIWYYRGKIAAGADVDDTADQYLRAANRNLAEASPVSMVTKTKEAILKVLDEFKYIDATLMSDLKQKINSTKDI